MYRCMGCMNECDEEYEICPHCGYIRGSKAAEAYYLQPETRLLNRYVIGKIVGSGGFGVTYLAWDVELQIKVAVKEFFPQGVASREGNSTVTVYTHSDSMAFENGKKRFLKEARSLAALNSVPGIVFVYNHFGANGTAYIVMEYLEGQNLQDYWKSQGKPLPLDFVHHVAENICSILSIVHARDIIHRDISPDNIFLCNNGTIKLIDFGASKQDLKGKKGTMNVIAKHGYAPIEQYYETEIIGPWTDIYALGATIYYLLTGQTPQNSVERAVKDMVQPPHILNPDIPYSYSMAIMKAMNLDWEARYNSADEFIHALNDSNKKTISGSFENPAVNNKNNNAFGGERGNTATIQNGDIIRLQNQVQNPVLEKKPLSKGAKIALIAGGAAILVMLTLGSIVLGLIHVARQRQEYTLHAAEDMLNISQEEIDSMMGTETENLLSDYTNSLSEIEVEEVEQISLTEWNTDKSMLDGIMDMENEALLLDETELHNILSEAERIDQICGKDGDLLGQNIEILNNYDIQYYSEDEEVHVISLASQYPEVHYNILVISGEDDIISNIMVFLPIGQSTDSMEKVQSAAKELFTYYSGKYGFPDVSEDDYLAYWLMGMEQDKAEGLCFVTCVLGTDYNALFDGTFFSTFSFDENEYICMMLYRHESLENEY